MTEMMQRKPTGRRSMDTRGYADEMAEVFGVYHDEEGLEGLRSDFAHLPAEEAVRELKQADSILQGLIQAAEDISFPLYMALIEAQYRAAEGRAVAKKCAERYADD